MERLRLYFFMFFVRLYYRIDTKKNSVNLANA